MATGAPPPRAILFDMDDTLIGLDCAADEVWSEVVAGVAGGLAGIAAVAAVEALMAASRDFWSDPARHREGRHNIDRTRRLIAPSAFRAVGRDDDALAAAIGDGFEVVRARRVALFEGAVEVLEQVRAAGVALALVTNGASVQQRAKIERFGLARHFDHIQVEGEVGFGKPEDAAYRHALDALGVAAADAWMVGDNYEWEVVAPKRLGLYADWHDHWGRGIPPDATARPDRVLRRIAELADDLSAWRPAR